VAGLEPTLPGSENNIKRVGDEGHKIGKYFARTLGNMKGVPEAERKKLKQTVKGQSVDGRSRLKEM